MWEREKSGQKKNEIKKIKQIKFVQPTNILLSKNQINFPFSFSSEPKTNIQLIKKTYEEGNYNKNTSKRFITYVWKRVKQLFVDNLCAPTFIQES